jgi:hypothetical protein
MEKSCITFGVSKWINVPSDSGANSKFIAYPLMSLIEIPNDILINGVALICSNPTTHRDLKLTSLDESFDIILHLFGLSCVPHIEELHFDVCE